MERVRAYGTFIKNGGNTFRTDTYIQFGKSNNIIGTCVLCNPGSSSLLNMDTEQQELLDKGYVVTGEIIKDNTIKQLQVIIEQTYGQALEGNLLIYNLFTLKNAEMKKATTMLSKVNFDEDILYKDFEKYKRQASFLPWVLIGWGCEDSSKVNKEKRKWLQYIKKNRFVYLGIEGKKEPHFLHPLQKIKSELDKYQAEIVDKFKSLELQK